LPAPATIYENFRADLQNSVTRLKTFDQIASYLDARIAEHPEIAAGVVLGVDPVSCANTCVGMKQIEEGEVAYLFVVYLQPLSPKAKCSPLFIIDSKSGMADNEIQLKIDEIIAITQSHVARVFLASDGDPSYNNRHHEFMAFWEDIYEKWGFERVLMSLKDYLGVVPLSDLLHLAKNFRNLFLKHLLTFTFRFAQID
jgi:hypothetical protein